MPRNGSGSMSILNTFVAQTVMSASAVNANMTDIGSEITGSLARDGQSAMTGQFQAIAGGTTAPGISFGLDTNTGFRRATEDEMRWVTGGVDRFWIDSVGKAFHQGDMAISGSVGLSAPIVLATTSASLLTLRRTENDTTARTVQELQSGSGAGAKADMQVIGDGNNAVATVRWRVNSAAIFEATGSLFTHSTDVAVGSNLRIDSDGFIDFTEIAEPTVPAANVARLFGLDVSGTTLLAFKDSAALVTQIGAGANRQQFDSNGTWTKPSFGTVALMQCWGAGGSGGRAGAGDGGGGGGGGAYAERLIALASLSASVSVTIGAGGTAQTVDDTPGNAGGDTTFGAYLSAFGGGGGGGTGAATAGAGGGGLTSAGAAGSGTSAGGGPAGAIGGASTAAANNSNPFGGAGGGLSGNVGGVGLYGGGGGGSGTATNTETVGGASVFGGGGGGGGSDTGTGAAGGAGIFYGGNGGAGATGAGVGTSGTAPAGGGGGSESGNSGAGAAGRVVVTVW